MKISLAKKNGTTQCTWMTENFNHLKQQKLWYHIQVLQSNPRPNYL